jgi:hypothetical protein
MNTLTPVNTLLNASIAHYKGISKTAVTAAENPIQNISETNPTSESINTQELLSQQRNSTALAPALANNASQEMGLMTLKDMTSPDDGLGTSESRAQKVMGDSFHQAVVNLYSQVQNMLVGNSTFSSLF